MEQTFKTTKRQKFSIIATFIFSIFTFIGLTTRVYAEELVISGNGADSSSEVQVSNNSQTQVTQSNQADINNEVNTSANTGGNQASDNNGETNIQTGDINSTTNVENTVNLSAAEVGCCDNSGTEVEISDNGSGSVSNTSLTNNSQTTVSIYQNATINNNIQGYASTGGNIANDNLGSVNIETGNISVSEKIQNHYINIASVSGSSGISGDILVKILANGIDSQNLITLNFNNSTNIYIDNKAKIKNLSFWNMVTGDNKASGNLGDVSIATGDIDFEAEIENGPMNIALVDVDCCDDFTGPDDSDDGDDDGNNPPASNPPSSGNGGGSSNGGSSSGGSAAGGQSGDVLGAALSRALPDTGSYWLFYMTILSALLFALGWYLRLHPGNSPGIKIA